MAGSSLSVPVIQSWLPGVHLLRTYDTRNLSSDVAAGLSVAAMAIPTGIAYAQLAGAPPGPLMAAVASILAVYLLSLNASGVRIIGTIPSGLPSPHGGVVVAVGLAMVKLLMLASKPHDAVLGQTPGTEGFVNLETNPAAKPISGVVIYRFDASLLFFNADYFASRVRQVIHDAGARPSVFVLDAESISLLDTTAANVLETLRAELNHDGIQLRIARTKGLFRLILERSGVADTIGREQLFGSVRAATYSSTEGDATCNQ